MTTTVLSFPRAFDERRDVIASNVRAEVARSGMSISAFGRALGMTQTQISRRMNASVDFAAAELWAAAELIGVDVADFYADKKPRPVGPDGVNRWAPRGSNPEPTD